MPLLIAYFLKLSISISVVFLFYQVLLRKLTFYTWNRWYLLGYSLLSFVIPLINIGGLMDNKKINGVTVLKYIPVIGNYTGNADRSATMRSDTVDVWIIVWVILLAGITVMAIRLIIQFLSLQKIKRKAVITRSGSTVIYHIDQPIIPFSFGKGIYINQNLHTEKEFAEIILHEYVHVRQRHTLDIILAEFLCTINWYNPFAWLLRQAIRQNLEFIADQEVLANGLDKKAYQYHLLKVVGEPMYRITSSFNFSSLKKRIIMMNKFKTARLHLVRFLFVLPLLAVLLLSFRDRYRHIFLNKGSYYDEAGIVMDANTYRPIPGVIIQELQSGLQALTDKNGFYSLKIPAQKDMIRERFRIAKSGYDVSAFEYENRVAPPGFIHIFGLFSLDAITKDTTMVFMGGEEPVNGSPSYEEVIKLYRKTAEKNDSFANLYAGKIKKQQPVINNILPGSEGHSLKKKDTLPPAPPLYYINGKEADKAAIDKIKSVDIESVSVLKDSMAISQFGDKAKNGVVMVTLKKPEPLYFVDGKEIDKSAMNTIKPSNIESVTVLKDTAAINRHGERGKNGVILIETKKRDTLFSNDGKKTDPPKAGNRKSDKNDSINIRRDTAGAIHYNSQTTALVTLSNIKLDPKMALYYIDGKKTTYAKLSQIDPRHIESMDIVKGDEALKRFGKKGKDGVIMITTKKDN